TAGLDAIRRSGGVTVVQDPGDAAYPDMPRHAIAHVRVDHVVPIARMGALIADLASQCAPENLRAPDDVVREAQITESYSIRGMRSVQRVERSLLFAIRALEERIRVLDRLNEQMRQLQHVREQLHFARERDEALAHIQVLRDLLASAS